MANDDHIALLKKGVAAWNAWRKEGPRPQLSGASFHGVDLSTEAEAEPLTQFFDRVSSLRCDGNN
jgi:hypothetical protein